MNEQREYLSIRQAAFIGVGAIVGAGIFALLGAALFPLQLLFGRFLRGITVVIGFVVDVPYPGVMQRPRRGPGTKIVTEWCWIGPMREGTAGSRSWTSSVKTGDRAVRPGLGSLPVASQPPTVRRGGAGNPVRLRD